MSEENNDIHTRVAQGVKAQLQSESLSAGKLGVKFDLPGILSRVDAFVQQFLPVLQKVLPADVAVYVDLVAEALKAADKVFNTQPVAPTPPAA